ncbi:cytochrome b-c1 complex subunit 7-like [Lineus longissimus]|uniref:cytochrome b-c1 complex subunit 7-like n=1 Tax=Lineus longissimus TaxID=88925 RepID=UPI00315C589A
MMRALQKWAYNKSGFCQYGLMRDDVLYETAEVKEAVRRLPPRMYDDRMFRICRALQLSTRKDILPKEEWMTFEKDDNYLTPYLNEVVAEKEEQMEWNKK